MKNARILVVDDDEPTRMVTAVMLTHLKLGYVAVESGEAALSEVRRGPFDLVLLDINMPGMDGFQVLARIRQSGDVHLPVLAVTAHVAPREEYLAAGFDGYLPKPFLVQQLSEAIRDFLGARAC